MPFKHCTSALPNMDIVFPLYSRPMEVLHLTQTSIMLRRKHTDAESALEHPTHHAISPVSPAQVGNGPGGFVLNS